MPRYTMFNLIIILIMILNTNKDIIRDKYDHKMLYHGNFTINYNIKKCVPYYIMYKLPDNIINNIVINWKPDSELNNINCSNVFNQYDYNGFFQPAQLVQSTDFDNTYIYTNAIPVNYIYINMYMQNVEYNIRKLGKNKLIIRGVEYKNYTTCLFKGVPTDCLNVESPKLYIPYGMYYAILDPINNFVINYGLVVTSGSLPSCEPKLPPFIISANNATTCF